MTYNELRNTIWANGTGEKKNCAASTCFGMPWHTPRHAMAPTKAQKETLDLKLGTPSKCLKMNLETHFGQMAREKKNLCSPTNLSRQVSTPSTCSCVAHARHQ
jgi:hypothetical protein